MTHKFKPGDKVRIIRKSTYDEMKGRGWTPSMDKFIGTTQMIEQTTSHNNIPGYKIVDEGWDFPECIFEKAEELPAKTEWPKFKAGDKVRCMHLDDIPGESVCGSGRKPYSDLKKGSIYTIQNVNLECKVDNANFYISLVEDNTMLHPGRFELVEDIVEIKPERYDVQADLSVKSPFRSIISDEDLLLLL